MGNIALIAMRALAGGTLVVVFALIAEVLTPKAFSGLFSAAPSVAFASLSLTIGFEGVAKARLETVGMVIGGIGMVAACVVATVSIPRIAALWGSLAAWIAWMSISIGLYWAVFVGSR